MILTDAVRLYLNRKRAEGLRPSSLVSLQNSFSHLSNAVGDDFDLSKFDATAEDVFLVFLSQLQPRRGDSLSKFTIRRHIRHLQALLVFASRRSNFDVHECGKIKVRKSKRVIWSVDELQQLRGVFSSGEFPKPVVWSSVERGVWWSAVFDFALLTGLRTSEILSIRWDWIHGDFLHLPGELCKSGTGRAVYLSPTVRQLLDGVLVFGPDGGEKENLVFPWPHVKRYLYGCVVKACEMAGFPLNRRTGLHALRRCHATMLATISPDAAKWSCGHSSSDVTWEHYVDRKAIKGSLDELGRQVDLLKGGAV